MVDIDAPDAAAEIRFGRRAGVEVELPFPTISGLHARLLRQRDGWWIEDLGSANGTWIGDKRLLPRVPRALQEGDVFRLADVEVALHAPERPGIGAAGPAGAESTATIARRLVSDLFAAMNGAERARIVIDDGPAAGQSLVLSTADHVYRAGRAPHCDLVLLDEDASREHAAFRRSWEGVVVSDLGSKNGVLLDGERLVGQRRLHDGDRMVIGRTGLHLDDPEDRYLRRMESEAERSSAAAPLTPPVEPVEAAEPARPGAQDAALVPDQTEARKTQPRTSGLAAGALVALAVLVLLGVGAIAVWFLLGE